TLAALTPRQRAAQLVHAWIVGDYESTTDSAFATTAAWVRDDGIGGVIMSVGSPVEVAVKVNALQALARVPLLISADIEPSLGRLEGGVYLPSMIRGGSATVIPTAMAIGATGDTALAYAAGRITGLESRAVGIHITYAPVTDVNVNPANPVINVRSFGEAPGAVAALGAAFVRGVQDGGAVATAKHFPGHGDTDTDSHNALPVLRLTRARLDSVELRPFRAAIEAGVASVMSAHIALPTWLGDDVPATLQPRVLTGLLRDSLGFRGLVITDALTMDGVARQFTQADIAIRAVRAGADVLLKPADVPPVITALTAEMTRDPAFAARVTEAARRNLALKARLGLQRGAQVSLDTLRAVVGRAEHRAIAQRIADRSVTLLRDDGALPMRGAAPMTVVTYAAAAENTAGDAFAAELRRATGATIRRVRVTPQTTRAELDSIATASAGTRLVVLTAVRRVEGAGRTAIVPTFADWVQAQVPARAPLVVATGNPYVIGQFPAVRRYLVTYSVGVAPERAAARAIAGTQPITGRSPVSLPGQFMRGDGVQR
ncbi:MAG: glycoside hydrolase family 3 protein, partial [Gemmatimonadaceae bacterium]|nr:glycoside hydrolase family 3 protein [Gemmatimonadaceae bacterium]